MVKKSGNFDSNIDSEGGKSHADFCQKDGIGFFWYCYQRDIAGALFTYQVNNSHFLERT